MPPKPGKLERWEPSPEKRGQPTGEIMTVLKTQGHVVWDYTYHIVITPKYRKKVLYGAARKEIGVIIRKLTKQKGIELVEGNLCLDHIHMVLSIPPKFSIANTMGFIKGKSAILIHHQLGKKNRPVTQKSFWSRSYFVRTVGIDEEMVKKYVKEQWDRDQIFDGNQLDFQWN